MKTLFCIAAALLPFALGACDADAEPVPEPGGSSDDDDDDVDPSEHCDGDWLSPCEVKACNACADLGGQLVIAESYPVQYGCDPVDGEQLSGVFDDAEYCRPPYCEESEREVGLDDKLADGSTAAELFADVKDAFSTTLRWDDGSTFEGVSLNNPEALSELTVSLEFMSETVTYVEKTKVVPETDGVPDVPPESVICDDELRRELTLTVSTDDGLLAEMTSASLLGFLATDENLDGEAPPPPHVDVELPLASLSGTLEVEVNEGDWVLRENLRFRTFFGEEEPAGTMEVGLSYEDESSVGEGTLLIAEWPSE